MDSLAVISLLVLQLVFPTLCCESTKEFFVKISTNSSELGCYQPYFGDSYHCHSLQKALELVSSTTEVCTLFNIHLEPAKHRITRPAIINSSVHIRGNISGDQASLVSCNFNADSFRRETGGLHTLYFNRSHSVKISGVIMENCPLPIRIDRSKSTVIVQSSFRLFSEAVFDIHNTIQVTVHNCSFRDNYGTGIINEPYRGNTGGLSITYNKLEPPSNNPNVTVSMTSFVNNSANPNDTLNSNQVFQSGVLTGRGGGLGVFIRENKFNIAITVYGCSFSKNIVKSYGGGMYILLNGRASHNAYIEDNVYKNNTAMIGGAGMILVGVGGHSINPGSYFVKGCKFIDNLAKIGGGIYYFLNLGGGRSNSIYIENSSFIGNYLVEGSESFGAAIATDIEEDFDERESLTTNTIKDCFFSENVGENSIVSIGLKPFVLSGKNQFIHNSGSVLRTVSAAMELSNTVEFINNTSVEGGAILLLSLSQLTLADDLQLLFDGNTGRFGASIVVVAAPSMAPFERMLHNPLCFFMLKSNPLLPPTEWKNFGINVTFTRSSALFGSAIYASSITSCSWVGTSVRQSFDISFFPKWPIFSIRNDNVNRALSDPYNQIHSIVTDPVDLELFDINNNNNSTIILRGWPGETLKLSMEAKDELGNPTGSLARLFFSSQNIELDPNTLLVSQENFTAYFTFEVQQDAFVVSSSIDGEIVIDNFGVSLLSRESKPESVTLIGTNCIGGYSLSAIEDANDITTCQCDTGNKEVVLCEEDQDSIIIQNDLWAIGSNGSLSTHACPIGYCRCFLNTSYGSDSCFNVFTNSDPNRQCVCGRKGILCGECNEGMGVTVLLNICSTSCDTGYISLIPILIFTIITIMMLVVIIDKPIPCVAYPVLFYVQTAPFISLHFPFSFTSIGKYLIFIGSALSFYFPFDFCIHPGMTTLDSFGLKFVPGITALVTIPAAVVLRYFLAKFIPLLSLQFFNGYGIWTVTLLVYTLTLWTAANVINCPMIPDNSGTFSPKWYLDGSVECFSGGHIPLTLFAIFWILLLVLIVPVAVLLTYKKSKKYIILKQIGVTLKQPFVKPVQFWCGIELFRRLLGVVLVTAIPTNSLVILLFIMVLLFLYGYWKPYKDKMANILEICLLVLLIILLMLRANHFLQDALEISLHSGQTSIPSCDIDGNTATVTSFSAILAVVYYLPALIGLSCLIVWMIIMLHQLWSRRCNSVYKKPKSFHMTEKTYETLKTVYIQSTEISFLPQIN